MGSLARIEEQLGRIVGTRRSFAGWLNQRGLEALRGGRRREPDVEVRPLARYDRLIPA